MVKRSCFLGTFVFVVLNWSFPTSFALSVDKEFRAVHRWADATGFGGGMRNYEQAEASNPSHVVIGTVRFPLMASINAPTSEIDATYLSSRFRTFHRWAGSNGYASAYPNAEIGSGVLGNVASLPPWTGQCCRRSNVGVGGLVF